VCELGCGMFGVAGSCVKVEERFQVFLELERRVDLNDDLAMGVLR